MKFLTDFTHRNLYGFARFPGDSTALVVLVVGALFKKAQGSVVSNRIGMKFGTAVLHASTDSLIFDMTSFIYILNKLQDMHMHMHNAYIAYTV